MEKFGFSFVTAIVIFTDGGLKKSATLVFMTAYDYYVQVINAIIFISFVTYALQCLGSQYSMYSAQIFRGNCCLETKTQFEFSE